MLLLLHRRADSSDLTGTLRYELWPGRGSVEFHFQVVRIWEVPVETLLAAGVGVAPLAPLGLFPEGVRPSEAIPDVMERLKRRILAEAPPGEQPTLLTSAFILAGLRLTKEQLRQLHFGVFAMRESSGYQLILDEGRAEGEAKGQVTGEAKGEAKGLRAAILLLGRKRFGAPGGSMDSALQAITDLERLQRLIDRVSDAADWQDLLATP